MSRVLVTGGAGFIGSRLTHALIASRHTVTVLDDLSTGRAEAVAPAAELVEGDVADPRIVRDVFERQSFDAVLHVAGQASIRQSFAHPERDLRTNVVGTLNVIEQCIERNVPRLLHASSMTVYGEPSQVPTPEDAPCRPVSYYGVTKYAAERYVLIAGHEQRGLECTALRMFNVYGEGQSTDNPYQGVLAIFIGNVNRGEPIVVHADGSQTRDFIYADDVVEAWLRLLERPLGAGDVYNLGSGRETSIRELADAVVAGFDRDGWDIRGGGAQPGDIRRSAADVTRLREAIGWEARTPLADGLRRTIAWAAAHAV